MTEELESPMNKSVARKSRSTKSPRRAAATAKTPRRRVRPTMGRVSSAVEKTRRAEAAPPAAVGPAVVYYSLPEVETNPSGPDWEVKAVGRHLALQHIHQSCEECGFAWTMQTERRVEPAKAVSP